MQTKTVVKVISLYDLIANNILLILATLHHIIILSFNNYSIEYIDHAKLDFPEHQKTFEEIHLNLEYCQAITLFTIFVIYSASKFMHLFKKITLEQIRVGIMVNSFISKMTITLHQIYYHYDNKFHKIFNTKHDMILIVIDLSYMVRFLILTITIILLFVVFMGLCLDKCLPHINHFAKNYKFTYVESTLVEEKHKV